jgi:acetyl-CoA carboxylase carboxyl transferase subunit alpha
MAESTHRLSFERPIYELEARIQELEALSATKAEIQKQETVSAQKTEIQKQETLSAQKIEARNEVRRLRRELTEEKKRIYGQLRPWETVEVARHPDRPMTTDYLELVFDEFVELHGDKTFGDDRAIRTGWAKLDTYKVMVVGHQKGKTLKERNSCFFGCAHPEGYRKAMAKMKMAAKFHMPVICMIDTPGAYPGIGAEERGQAQVIASSMFEMSRLPTPVICVVIGEGGSGGALGIGVGDRVAMLEHAYYSVISPEGCAGILWKSHTYKEQAAQALKMTSKDLLRLAVVDDVIREPLGGAHRDHHLMANRLKIFFRKSLRELIEQPIEQLLEARYQKFRRMGVFLEGGGGQLPVSPAACRLPAVEPVNGDGAVRSPHRIHPEAVLP